MLSAQVEYWKLMENQRHNLVTEQQGWFNATTQRYSAEEQGRHNLVTEDQGYKQLDLGNRQLAETMRHNQTTEYISAFEAQEKQRHNLVSEDQGYINLAENERSHRANESIGWANVGVAQQNADTNARNAETNWVNAQINAQNAEYYRHAVSAQEQQAATAQYRAETERQQGSERLAYTYLGYTTDAYNAELNAERNDIQWTQVTWNGLLGTSKEARGWVSVLLN